MEEEEEEEKGERKGDEDQLSLLAFVVTVLRKSLAGCRTEGGEEDLRSMEIGWPTNVQHVAHVTFDRFHGFLGLPVEFEPEILRRAPSARSSFSCFDSLFFFLNSIQVWSFCAFISTMFSNVRSFPMKKIEILVSIDAALK